MKPKIITLTEKSTIVITSEDDFLDIRQHVVTKKYTGPTAKGIRLPQDPELLKALRLAIKKHDRSQ